MFNLINSFNLFLNSISLFSFIFTITSIVIVSLIKNVGKPTFNFTDFLHFILPFTYQNYGHIKALENILNFDNKLFISIICFSNQAKIKVNCKSSVTQVDNLNKIIKSFQNIQINNDINLIKDKILSLNITDKNIRKSHINNIKEKIQKDNDKVNNMICPKCGGNLTSKSGKYGSFIGCDNFPKCKYTKK